MVPSDWGSDFVLCFLAAFLLRGRLGWLSMQTAGKGEISILKKKTQHNLKTKQYVMLMLLETRPVVGF